MISTILPWALWAVFVVPILAAFAVAFFNDWWRDRDTPNAKPPKSTTRGG